MVTVFLVDSRLTFEVRVHYVEISHCVLKERICNLLCMGNGNIGMEE